VRATIYSNGFEAASEMKELSMRTAVKTRRAATLERVRELPEDHAHSRDRCVRRTRRALSIHSLPVSLPAADKVLIAMDTAGVEQWDADMGEGLIANRVVALVFGSCSAPTARGRLPPGPTSGWPPATCWARSCCG
jgi:hypothetical protein